MKNPERHEAAAADLSDRRNALIESYPFDDPNVVRELDRIAGVAATVCNAPSGFLSIAEGQRLRFVGRKGIDLTDAPQEGSFWAHAMPDGRCFVVADALEDDRFRDHPLVAGEPFIRFYAGQPIVTEGGVALGCLSVIDDRPRAGLNEDQRHAMETLGRAAMALLERWRLEKCSQILRAQSRGQIAELEQRFQVLADALPQLVWSADGSGMVDYLNRGWCDFTGYPAEASYGRGWMRFLHDDDRESAASSWLEAVSEGKDYEIEYRLQRADGGHRWVLARGMPLRSSDGAITRWIGTCTDIHEQKATAERLEILSRELSHRIKNIFAVIGGLIALTIRSKPEFADTAAELRERVLALGRAHDLVRSRGGSSFGPQARLEGLLRNLTAPYQDKEGERIVILGDEVAIDDRSATPLALFFHELATNAAKYGALSHGEGRVEVIVSKRRQVELVWSESGGPPACDGGAPGFGSSLVDMSIVRQLGGTLDYDWRNEGLRVTARIPLESLTR